MTDLFKKNEGEQAEVPPSLEYRVAELEKDMAALKAANAHLFHCEEEETNSEAVLVASSEEINSGA